VARFFYASSITKHDFSDDAIVAAEGFKDLWKL
jgi:hypothetical protein